MRHHPFRDVLPALTTPFTRDGTVDLEALALHARWQLEQGCSGVIPLGSLGEGAVLDRDEKRAVLQALVDVAGTKPVLPGIGAASTRDAVRLAEAAVEAGCRGLMVLPPYAHRGPFCESLDHVAAVLRATALPCMLYNNPAAYGVDFTPDAIAELLPAHGNLVAVKESSGDVRRITALRAACGDRLDLLVGLDDLVLEGIAAGATGWVAGLGNAFPDETVALYGHARAGRTESAQALYRWFLPLLRLDTLPEFVQAIKLVQHAVGRGEERVRAPRWPLAGELRDRTLATLERALAQGPEVLR